MASIKEIQIGNKTITVLNLTEKAKELNVATKTLQRWVREGKMAKYIVFLPDNTNKRWFLPA